MTTVVDVSPITTEPTHHISLSDGVTTIGLIAVKPDGTQDYGAVRREPYPRSTIKAVSSEGGLSETKPPYGELTRNDWSGGMGQPNAEEDRTRFYFAKKLWMTGEGKVLSAPRVMKAFLPDYGLDTYASKPTENAAAWAMTAGTYYAFRFAAPVTTGVYGVHIKIHLQLDGTQNPAPGVYAGVWTANVTNDKPATELAYGTLNPFRTDDEITIPFNPTGQVTSGTYYFVVVRMSSLIGFSSVKLLRNADITTIYCTSADGVTWTTETAASLVFDVQFLRYTSAIPFDYKYAQYAIINPWGGGAPKLFLNGDRGVATTNTDKLKLIDTTKSWATNIWTGATVRIIEGAGAGQSRKISSNNGTTLTITDQGGWDVAPTANSVYVISFTDQWQEITGHGMTNPVTSVAVTNEDVIYFAFGDAANIRRGGFYNNAGAWAARTWTDETTKAHLLTFCWDQAKKSVLWRALNGSKPSVARATVPAWGTAITWETDIFIGGDAPIQAILYYDGKLAVRKADSIWMIQDGLPEPLSIDMASRYSDEHGINNMAVLSPYLIFPYGNKVQRLLGQLAENMNLKLPRYYAGEPVSFASVPNGLFVGIAGTIITAGYTENFGSFSGVYVYHDGAWFPIANLPLGNRLLSIDYQRIDGGRDILWIFSTNGVYYVRIPREWDYTNDPALLGLKDLNDKCFQLENYGFLWQGAFFVGNKRLYKWWEDIYLSWNDTSLVNHTPQIFYNVNASGEVENEGFLWATNDPLVARNYRIRFKSRVLRVMIGLYMNQSWFGMPGVPPLAKRSYLDGLSLSYLARVDDADTWIVPIVVEDYGLDLNGTAEDETAKQKQDILDGWSRDVTPLTMRTIDGVDDNKRVILGRNPRQPLNGDTTIMPDSGERNYAFNTSVTIYEVD